MATTSQRMACGNCGDGQFEVTHVVVDDRPFQLHMKCTHCGSTSIVRTRPAELEIGWGDNADGILCPMDPTR